MNHSSAFPARRAAVAMAVVACLGAVAVPASAADLLTGFGGTFGFGQQAMAPNDDGSSNQLNLPFAINFFGNTFDRFFVNNNGNVTFNSPLGLYTPSPFPVSNQPMIAPYWADVDTRGGVPSGNSPSNAVYVASPNASLAVVTWHNVGYYAGRTDKLNDFQLVLRNRADTGTGNFDIDFRYHQLQWTTGDASGGSNGFGGVPAQAGYDDGRASHFLALPGSRTPEVLNLVNTSNVSANTPGLWTFAVRNGQTPGTEVSNPLQPVVVDNSYTFQFNVQQQQRVFIDPLVAVGYDYDISNPGAQSFHSVLLPNVGDGLFELSLWNGSSFVSTAQLSAGTEYFFAGAGVTRFRISGIETSANLDPANTAAFVTGLSFNSAGAINMSQTPITVFVPVPEPSVYAMLLLGGAMLAVRRRQSSKAA